MPPACRCALSAACASHHGSVGCDLQVEFHGDRYLHGMIGHSFAGSGSAWLPRREEERSVHLRSADPLRLAISGRARQFSSFILLVGRIGGPSLFLPSAAIVISNKDEVKIQLELEKIPTPKVRSRKQHRCEMAGWRSSR